MRAQCLIFDFLVDLLRVSGVSLGCKVRLPRPTRCDAVIWHPGWFVASIWREPEMPVLLTQAIASNMIRLLILCCIFPVFTSLI